ncbi:defensin-like protein [Panicum miliaceum]|uniref:Defensin-like protein n=1 Tax=Panicum miliaceum TaxID=4540 RepID=A0A3L6QDA9_PANMI|nr:defensin-like protein [Panicum miliaceum]
MALSRGMALFFFLLLIVAAEIGTIDAKGSTVGKETVSSLTKDKEMEREKQEEEKNKGENQCLSQSFKFKGFCLSSETCAEVCKEGFPGGKCKLENAPSPGLAVLCLHNALVRCDVGLASGHTGAEEDVYDFVKHSWGSTTCPAASHQFKGFCLSSDTCAEVCQKEGFHGGECKLENAMRKCFCKKPC